MKNKRGITLISLVITIVVLVILSAVAINLTLGNNGILNKAEQAKNETTKQAATEKMNLKITNMQIEKYAKEQRMPTLQEFSDGLCEDDEIQYVELESKKVGSLDKIEVGEAESIFTKLKEYPYEFEINSSLQLASIDGIKVADNNSSTNLDSIIPKSEDINDFEPEIEVIGKRLEISANVTVKNNINISGYIYIVNGKIYQITEKNNIVIDNLEFDKEYDISVIVIDENAKGKRTNNITVRTEAEQYLLNASETYEKFTGGYKVGFASSSNYNSYSLGSDGYWLAVAYSGNVGALTTNKKIDMTNVNTLTVDFEANSNDSTLINTIYLAVSDNTNPDRTFTKCVEVSGVTPINRQKMELDVSDLTGEYYIKVVAYHGTNVSAYTTYATIYSILMK